MSVTLHTTHGDMKLEIFCDSVPRTSFNFLALVASGYYDGTLFHRNVRGFMLQGGDPTGSGKGGESIWGGKFNDELRSENTHSARGIVSMANSGPNTNGSQFFITYAKHPHLDNNYTVFGKGALRIRMRRVHAVRLKKTDAFLCNVPCHPVIDGWDALAAIERVPCNEKHRPLNDVRIENITMHANPLADQMIVFPTSTGPPDIQT